MPGASRTRAAQPLQLVVSSQLARRLTKTVHQGLCPAGSRGTVARRIAGTGKSCRSDAAKGGRAPCRLEVTNARESPRSWRRSFVADQGEPHATERKSTPGRWLAECFA